MSSNNPNCHRWVLTYKLYTGKPGKPSSGRGIYSSHAAARETLARVIRIHRKAKDARVDNVTLTNLPSALY